MENTEVVEAVTEKEREAVNGGNEVEEGDERELERRQGRESLRGWSGGYLTHQSSQFLHFFRL